MSPEYSKHLNPEAFATGPVYIFDLEMIPSPPDTPAAEPFGDFAIGCRCHHLMLCPCWTVTSCDRSARAASIKSISSITRLQSAIS